MIDMSIISKYDYLEMCTDYKCHKLAVDKVRSPVTCCRDL